MFGKPYRFEEDAFKAGLRGPDGIFKSFLLTVLAFLDHYALGFLAIALSKLFTFALHTAVQKLLLLGHREWGSHHEGHQRRHNKKLFHPLPP
jgi:hypothetical protein